MLAFCCGDPTLRTSHIEARLNIDSAIRFSVDVHGGSKSASS